MTTIVPVSGDGEIAAGDAHARLEIFVAEVFSGDGGEFFVNGGEGFAEFFLEELTHVGHGEVDGGGDDMHRSLVGELHDVFAQIGFDRADAVGFQHVVQLHFLGDHRFRFDDAFDVVFAGDVEDILVCLGGIVRVEDGDAAGGDVLLETRRGVYRDWR